MASMTNMKTIQRGSLTLRISAQLSIFAKNKKKHCHPKDIQRAQAKTSSEFINSPVLKFSFHCLLN